MTCVALQAESEVAWLFALSIYIHSSFVVVMPRNICITTVNGHTGFAIGGILLTNNIFPPKRLVTLLDSRLDQIMLIAKSFPAW